MRNLLLALLLTGLVPWTPAQAAAQPPSVVVDRTEAAVEVGTTFTINYSILPGTDADGAPVCPASPAAPVTLTTMTTWSLGAFPQSFVVTSCLTSHMVTVTASAVGVATVVVGASGGSVGFISTASATITAYVHSKDDAEPPQISVPQEVQEAEATSPLGAQVYVSVSASDNQTTPPQVSCSPTGPWYPLGLTRVNCTALDANGNLGRAHYWVLVYDRTPPAIASPGDITLWPTAEPIVSYAPATWDLVWERTPLVCDPPSGSRFPAGTTTVRCTSTDGSGNTGYANFTVTIIDIVRPKVLATDMVVEATGPGGALVTLNALAVDFIDPNPVMTCTPPSGSMFPLGVTNVTCTARDASGNTASKTFKVTVVDTTPPVITLPATVTAAQTSLVGATVTWPASALDLVAGSTLVTCTPPNGSLFPPGTTRVNCTSVDGYGNRAWRDLDVAVVDASAPIILAPGDVTLEATSLAGATYAYNVTATDAGGATVACVPSSGSVFPMGATLVTCTARDAAGNTATATFTVTVRDTTPPVLTLPTLVTHVARNATGGSVSWASGSMDTVWGDLSASVSCAPPAGSWFPVGDTLVTCTSTDGSGNTATRSFTVRVLPLTPPTVAVPPPATLEATGPLGAPYAYTATGWDAMAGAPLAPTCAPASGSTFPLGTTTITCTVTDSWGQTASATTTVTVVDTTPPALTLPASLSVAAPDANGTTVSWSASAYDLVSLSTAVLCTPASGSVFPVGTTTVVCTSTDAAGNTATARFPVTVSGAAACTVDGWRAPLNTPGHTKTGINTFRAGSTIPVKIQTHCGQECDDDDDDDHAWSLGRSSKYGDDRSRRDDDDDDDHDDCDDDAAAHAQPRLSYAPLLPGGSLGPERAATSKSRAYTANLFNEHGNHWQYDWDTRGLPAGTYRLRVDLGGAVSTIDVRLR